ncbi:1-acyl-sn-glycerol-3-phosphate acyltransferase [Rhodococcus rhodochrous J45]|uniref:1-acyl-sn-glycerol-3-phosphate acyltransferase n=2 Tax=Nocardiaceae TaxID=85025 RepID=A0A562ENB7_RHORH|nr:1-acyl-sn-glycerol-3-phosphate acyltransferase [Rhodococcus rhodochrous J45]
MIGFGKDAMWYWLFKYVLLGPLLWLIGRPKFEGGENIPAHGPAILASNHRAVLDSFYLPLLVRRRITFLAKSEYFTGTGLKGAFQRWFFSSVGQVPIDRTGADAAQDALNAGVRVLGQGKLLGIYPEGTRSPDGRLYKGKTGLARLALETGVPVIPVAMIGTDRMNPIGSKMWRPAKITVRIGEPIDFSRFEGMGGNRFVERTVTDEVMYSLMQLSGQEYVDIYAASLKNKSSADESGTAGNTDASTNGSAATAPQDGSVADRVPDTRAG